MRAARRTSDRACKVANRLRGKLCRPAEVFDLVVTIAAGSLNGELRIYGVHQYDLGIEEGALRSASTTDTQHHRPTSIFDAAVGVSEGYFDFAEGAAVINPGAFPFEAPLHTLLADKARRDAAAYESHCVEQGRAVLAPFNSILREIFRAAVSDGDVDAASTRLQELLRETDMGSYLGPLEADFSVSLEAILPFIERTYDASARSTLSLHPMLHTLITCAVLVTARTMPHRAEVALTTHVLERLGAVKAPKHFMRVTRH